MRNASRGLGLLAVVALAGLSLPSHAADFQKSAIPGWRLALQAWTFNHLTLLETLDMAKQLGIGYVEAYPGQRISKEIEAGFGPGIDEAQTKAVKDKMAETGVRIIAFGVTGLPGDEEGARKVFQWAKDMGILSFSTEEPKERFALLDKLSQEFGILIALHNHPKESRYWDPQKVVDDTKGVSPNIGACADTGHWQRSGLNSLESLKKLEGRVVSLHFKDLSQGNQDVPFGTGTTDAKGMLAELQRQGFKGTFSIEYEHKDDKLVDNVRQCVFWWNQTLDELAADPAWKLSLQAYTFRRLSLLDTIQTAKDLGIEYLEAYPGQKVGGNFADVNFGPAAPPEAQQAVKDKLQETGVRIRMFGVTGIPADEAAARRMFEWGRGYGLDAFATEVRETQFPVLAKLVDEYGIRVALHNHPAPRSYYWDPAFAAEKLKGVEGKIGACADTGHWNRSGLDPVESLRKLEGNIIYLHFKDLNLAPNEQGQKTDVPWGTGKSNARGQLEELKRQGFRGYVSIEYETGEGDALKANVAKCVEWFNAARRELGMGRRITLNGLPVIGALFGRPTGATASTR